MCLLKKHIKYVYFVETVLKISQIFNLYMVLIAFNILFALHNIKINNKYIFAT